MGCAFRGTVPARQSWRRARPRTRRPCAGASAGWSRSALLRWSLARGMRPEWSADRPFGRAPAAAAPPRPTRSARDDHACTAGETRGVSVAE
eukprot:scaffold5584_cov110-Isochrysis_galbana.AAC.9